MTVLSQETKARIVREAFAKLAGEYMSQNRLKEAQGVLSAQIELNSSGLQKVGQFNETLARLYEIITTAA